MTDETTPARAGDGIPAPGDTRRDWARWPSAVAEEMIRRTAAGEAMRAICRDPQMPSFRATMTWMKKRPGFRTAIEGARAQAGRSFIGGPSTYCSETAEIIFQRLCEGEGLVRMCREDPSLPAPSTVYRWMAANGEFRAALALARAIAAEVIAEKANEIADAATPETAYLTDVRLKHLRWHAAKLEPRKYGTFRPQDPAPPADEDDRNNLIVIRKEYRWDGEPVEGGREEELYRMKIAPPTPTQKRAAALEDAQEREREKQAAKARAQADSKPWDPEGWT